MQSDVIVRQERQLPLKPLLPVMVWFHGGGYVRGGSYQFGPAFMMREDIVLVTVNYRLGVLGNLHIFLLTSPPKIFIVAPSRLSTSHCHLLSASINQNVLHYYLNDQK